MRQFCFLLDFHFRHDFHFMWLRLCVTLILCVTHVMWDIHFIQWSYFISFFSLFLTQLCFFFGILSTCHIRDSKPALLCSVKPINPFFSRSIRSLLRQQFTEETNAGKKSERILPGAPHISRNSPKIFRIFRTNALVTRSKGRWLPQTRIALIWRKMILRGCFGSSWNKNKIEPRMTCSV